MTNPNAFYGGGHSMKSAADLAFWALRTCSYYYGPSDVFLPPKATLGDSQTYQRIANCVELAGGSIPMQYVALYSLLFQNDHMVPPAEAMRTRGAILLNQGSVSVSMGDGRRVVVEENYRLYMKFVNNAQPASQTFEYGARVPGLDYL